jgi:hypothetical protein
VTVDGPRGLDEWGEGGFGHVAAWGGDEFVVDLDQERADEPDDGLGVGKIWTTSVRRFSSRLSRSIGWWTITLAQCAGGKAV